LPTANAGKGGSFIGAPSLKVIPHPHGSVPQPSAVKSAPVKTASTPAVRSAAPLSIAPIVACAFGERTTTP
jgi:hypothetical protein